LRDRPADTRQAVVECRGTERASSVLSNAASSQPILECRVSVAWVGNEHSFPSAPLRQEQARERRSPPQPVWTSTGSVLRRGERFRFARRKRALCRAAVGVVQGEPAGSRVPGCCIAGKGKSKALEPSVVVLLRSGTDRARAGSV
jgi:hypothetical protein